MTPFWHPVSAVCLADAPAVATPAVLHLLFRADSVVELRYAGDRMTPALRDGMVFRAHRVPTSDIVPGDAVVAVAGGVPDIYRVDASGDDGVALGADADPEETVRVAASAIVARVDVNRRRDSRRKRAVRRRVLDLDEALRHGPDPAPDAAATVRAKYDGQAMFYSELAGPGIEPRLLARIGAVVSPGSAVLVAGSGSGREAFALAGAGYRVTGVDFSPAMVAHARAAAAERGLGGVEFIEADLRSLDLGPARFAAVVFTYDVYSFLPSRAERADVIDRLSRLLAPSGVVFLSARRVRSAWARFILTLVRARGHTRPREWGATHTRYVASDGSLRRSFVRHFTQGQLLRELAPAGFELGAWEGGHGICRRGRV